MGRAAEKRMEQQARSRQHEKLEVTLEHYGKSVEGFKQESDLCFIIITFFNDHSGCYFPFFGWRQSQEISKEVIEVV